MIEEIEKYAHVHKVPIMLSDGIEYLCNYIRDNNIKNILEIGSAIGYSAIKMAMVDDSINVTTIEKDIDRYNIACNNIEAFGLSNRINIILGDAMDVVVDSCYDLIFIDASKGHNIDFFNKYKENLSEYGVIITDNLAFHGLVDNDELVKTKNQRGIVKKIKMFIEFLNNNSAIIFNKLNTLVYSTALAKIGVNNDLNKCVNIVIFLSLQLIKSNFIIAFPIVRFLLKYGKRV